MSQDEQPKKPADSSKEPTTPGAEIVSESDILPPGDADLEGFEDTREEEAQADTGEQGPPAKFQQTRPYGVADLTEQEMVDEIDSGDIVVDATEEISSDELEVLSEAEKVVETDRKACGSVPWKDTEKLERPEGDPRDTFEEPAVAKKRSTHRGRSPLGKNATAKVPDWQGELDDTGRDEMPTPPEGSSCAPEVPPWEKDLGDTDEVVAAKDTTPTSPEDEASVPAAKSIWAENQETQKIDKPMPDAGPTRVEKDHEPGKDAAGQVKTLIYAEGAEAASAESPLLTIVQGDEEGHEYELNKKEMTIGRGADNDLVVPDIACSRRHALLQQQGDDYLLVDLGSGNGTLVNEKRIQKVRLNDGDQIEIGSTILQFVHPGGKKKVVVGTSDGTVARSQTLRSRAMNTFMKRLIPDPKRRKLILFGGGSVLGLLLVLFLVKVIATPPGPSQAELEEIRRLEEKQKKKELEQNLDTAKKLVRERKWEEAGLRIQVILKMDPENQYALDYRNYVKREMVAAKALQTARSLMEQKDWDSAMGSIGKIGEESVYFEEAGSLKREIEVKAKTDLLAQGRELLKQANYAQSILKFDELLTKDPNNEEAATLKRQAEQELAKQEAMLAAKEREREKKKNQRQTNTPVKKVKGVAALVLTLYKAGEIDQAIDKAESSGSTQLEVQLKKFRSLYKRGMEMARNPGQAADALQHLTQALKEDQAISGGQGKFYEEITEKLSRVYLLKAVDAKQRERYPEAYKAYNAALKYRPEQDRAKQGLKDLEKVAKRYYEEAYVIKGQNQELALKKLNVVLQIVPAGNLYYDKAKRLKDQIQGPVGREPDTDSGF